LFKGLKEGDNERFLFVKPDETILIGGPGAEPLKVYLSSNLTPGGREHTTFKYLNLTLDPSQKRYHNEICLPYVTLRQCQIFTQKYQQEKDNILDGL